MKKGITALTIISAVALLAATTHAIWPFGKRNIPLKELKPDRIVLITIDTLRADHLSSYGYPRETSPFIDSLAKEGVLFKRLISSMSLTSPAHASIFTALYPIQHNLLRNGQKLDSSYVTMAELLAGAGYKTAGFVATNSHFRAGNMDQGFDLLDEPVIKRPERRRGMPADNDRRAGPAITKTGKPLYRQADATVNLAIKWLDSVNREDKFFLWLHFYEPHRPYGPPQEYVEKVESQTERERRSFADFLIKEHKINYDDFIKEPEKILPIINGYDAEIMFADNEIKRLYQYFENMGLNSDTLWIITADHGEGLGGHKALTHGRHVYNEQIHIPLIFHFTSGGVKGIVAEQVVEQVDILPTLAELVGIDLSGQIKPVEGASLLPLMLKDYGHYPSKYAFSHKWAADREELPEFMKKRYEARRAFRMKLIEEMRNNGNQRLLPERIPRTEDDKKSFKEEKFALQDKDYKYIFNTLRKDEFYNLVQDPYEVNNLIGMGLKEEDRFRDALMLKVTRLKESVKSKPESVDRETIERLKSLGYMQ